MEVDTDIIISFSTCPWECWLRACFGRTWYSRRRRRVMAVEAWEGIACVSMPARQKYEYGCTLL